MRKRVTTEEFIKRARARHGDKYDYSNTVYVAAKQDVIIICSKHGEFGQRPWNHLLGKGCRECAGNMPLTKEKFVDRANKIFSNRYDYSRVEFNSVECKVEIICPVHGSFMQRVMSHLKGFGCDRCGRIVVADKLSHSRERFLEDAKAAHGEKYDYSQVEYVNAHIKVTIICPKHGAFKQRPLNHIRDVGCSKCGDENTAAKRTKTTDEFVKQAKVMHGNKYDYSKVQYKSSHEKVEIVCPEHGSFWQSPINHTKNIPAGCPGCASSGFDQTKPGILYYIAVKADDGKTLYKIGITNLTIERRFPVVDRARMRVVRLWKFEMGQHAAEREGVVISEFARYKYYGPDVLVGSGNTELFTKDILGLDGECCVPSHRVIDLDANLINKPQQLELGIASFV